MKNKLVCLFLLIGVFTTYSSKAQNIHNITLQQAVKMALLNSDQAKISDAKVITAKEKLKVSKGYQYPDLKISGQYQYFNNANVDIKLDTKSNENNNGNSGNKEESSMSFPKVNNLFLGQASLSMPLFSGFKIRNTVKASENNYHAAVFMGKNDKEQIAIQTINMYVNLYKSLQTINLVKKNLKSAEQRVKDFTAMEQNGILARNDLLKAQLHESDVALTLEQAKKNAAILNYRLVAFLKLPKNMQIQPSDATFNIILKDESSENSISRADIEALRFQKAAAENYVKTAKSSLYPSIELLGGYIAADLPSAITVTNAIDVGVGISYNLADIFKAKSNIKVAQSQERELQYTLDDTKYKVDVAVKNAKEEYKLAIKSYNVYTKSEEQATENYRIVKDKYNNGLVDTNDLLDADVQRLQAEINLTYAKADIVQKYYELRKEEGKLVKEINKK